MKNPFKELTDKYQKAKEPLNLKKRFPWLINKHVARVFFVLILLVVGADFYLNDYNFYTYSAECAYYDFCENPYYNKSDFFSAKQCDVLKCDTQYLYNGEKIGRTDFIAAWGVWLMVLLFIAIFPVSIIINKLVKK